MKSAALRAVVSDFRRRLRSLAEVREVADSTLRIDADAGPWWVARRDDEWLIYRENAWGCRYAVRRCGTLTGALARVSTAIRLNDAALAEEPNPCSP